MNTKSTVVPSLNAAQYAEMTTPVIEACKAHAATGLACEDAYEHLGVQIASLIPSSLGSAEDNFNYQQYQTILDNLTTRILPYTKITGRNGTDEEKSKAFKYCKDYIRKMALYNAGNGWNAPIAWRDNSPEAKAKRKADAERKNKARGNKVVAKPAANDKFSIPVIIRGFREQEAAFCQAVKMQSFNSELVNIVKAKIAAAISELSGLQKM